MKKSKGRLNKNSAVLFTGLVFFLAIAGAPLSQEAGKTPEFRDMKSVTAKPCIP